MVIAETIPLNKAYLYSGLPSPSLYHKTILTRSVEEAGVMLQGKLVNIPATDWMRVTGTAKERSQWFCHLENAELTAKNSALQIVTFALTSILRLDFYWFKPLGHTCDLLASKASSRSQLQNSDTIWVGCDKVFQGLVKWHVLCHLDTIRHLHRGGRNSLAIETRRHLL